MTDLKDILVSGKAQNTELNTTTEDSKQMQAYFETLFKPTQSAEVHGLIINTTEQGASPSALIPLDEIEPQPKDDMKFFYALHVSTPAVGSVYWDVYSWLQSVKHNGIEMATRSYMGQVDPNFSYLNIPPVYAGLEAALTDFYESC